MSTPQQFAKHLDEAVRALALGDRSADSWRPSRREAATAAALAAYRDGIRWALTAESDGDSSASDGETDLGTARERLRGLIRTMRRRHPSPRRLARRRRVQVVMVAALALVALVAGWAAAPDGNLAAGKRWTVSSADPSCPPNTGMCSDYVAWLMCHTRQEESPWVQVDLDYPQRFSSVTVTNRRDCCKERAVPLILEVSSDHVHYTKVAEQTEPFSEWKAAFPPVTARFLRVRVPRQTILHLERITVH